MCKVFSYGGGLCGALQGCAHRMRHSKHIHIRDEVYGGSVKKGNLLPCVDVAYASMHLVRYLHCLNNCFIEIVLSSLHVYVQNIMEI